MVFCRKCGTQLSDGDNFCPRCGTPTDISYAPGEAKEDLQKERQHIIIWDEKKESSLSKNLKWLFFVLLIGGGLIGYSIYTNLAKTTVTTSVEETNPEQPATGDIQLIQEWYDFVLGKKYTKDGVIDKYLSNSAKEKLSKDDDGSNIGVCRYWLFRTANQKTKDKGENIVESITSDGGGWYEVKYLDMGWNGVTKVRVSGEKIVDYKRDSSWDLYYNEQSKNSIPDWLQGHWVYDVDILTDIYDRIHVVIKGNRIRQYRNDPSESANPTFVIENGEIRTQYKAGKMTTYSIDPAKHAISYKGRGWMYKLGSEEEIRHRVGFENENVFFIKISNQVFRNQDGEEIRIDDSRKLYFDDVYAGILSIVKLEKVKAIVTYSGGDCGEGKFEIRCDLMTRNFLQIITHNNFYHQIIK